MALWLLGLVVCVYWKYALVEAVTCDSTCQQSQVTALVDLYASNFGNQWYRPGGWASITSSTSLEDACNILEEARLVLCCDPSQPACSMTPGSRGVTALLFPGMNLQGTLSAGLITAL